MVASKPTPKNWATKTVIDRFATKVESVLGENILNPQSPARKEQIGDVLDWLIQADYGMTINYPNEDLGPLFDTGDEGV